MQYRLQYCNEVHYVNSGYSWGAMPPQLETWGGGRVAPLPPPTSYAYEGNSSTIKQVYPALIPTANTDVYMIQYSSDPLT